MPSKLVFRISLVILTLVLKSPAAMAQALVQWAIVAGTSQGDGLLGSAISPAGEIYTVGAFGYSGSIAVLEAVLFKYDSTGQLTSTQAGRGDYIRGITLHSDGGYYLTGSVRDNDVLGMGRNFDFYLAKYSANGTIEWERTAGTLKESDRARLTDGQSGDLIALDAAGNIYVAGESTGPAVYGDKAFPNTVGGPLLCKFGPDGTLRWVRRAESQRKVVFGSVLPGGGANKIALDPAGNVFISGYMVKGKATFEDIAINVTGTYDYGAFVAKYSPTGQILWAKPIPFGDVAVDQEGNTLISGPLNNGQAQFDGNSTAVDDPAAYKAFVAKFDPAGELIWTKAAPVGGLLADSSGNVYSGSAKLTPTGDLAWARIIPGAVISIRCLNDRQEPVFTGTIKGTVNLDDHMARGDNDEYDDYVICKADVSGKFQWAVSVTSGNLERGLSIGPIAYGMSSVLSDRNGNLLVFGAVVCPWSFEQQTSVCDAVGKFGDFPISVQMGNDDFWLARISDPAPVTVELKAARTASSLTLSWPVSATGFVLESADALPAANWSAVPDAPSVVGDQNVVTVAAGSGTKFYRLRKP